MDPAHQNDAQRQPQAPPQHPPPPDGMGAEPARPAVANTDSRRFTSAWPSGQVTAVSASAMERRVSNVVSQA